MKKGFLREKAIFQILILLIAVIYFSYAIKPAEAATNMCCEKTINEQYCFYGDSSNCDPSKQYAAVSCEQTSFCQPGCCYDIDEGMCYRNVPQSRCLSTDGGEWYKDTTCKNVGECRLGCCVIGSQCFMATEQSCAIKTAQYPELELDFRSDVTTEPDCQNVCRAKDKGCCVNLDKSCAYETREACDTAKGSFYNQQYCSDIALCGCSKHNKKECRDDDVYWLDSCGNLEDKAEDCDYSQGTICKKTGEEYKCGSTNCEKTYKDEKNVHDPNMGGFRKNGESWCVYESGTGDYMDRPGTRHYRHMCVNGQEIIESCRDLREEVCAQGNANGLTEAQCLHNDIYESPITEQVSTVPRGFQFWEDKGECDKSTVDCTVVWVKKDRKSSWKCEQNCECETQEFVDKVAKACKSLGDCGADMNILGEKTTDGLVMSKKSRGGPPSGQPSESAWNEWKKYGVFGGMVDLLEKVLAAVKDAEIPELTGMLGLPQGVGEAVAAGVAAYATLLISWYATGGVGLSAAGILGAGESMLYSVLPALGPWGIVILVVVVVITYILFSGGKTETHHVVIECKPWVAPKGGKNCGKCLDQKKVGELEFYDTCTEYKCRSLGLNCKYIEENAGSERVACYDSNPNDVNSPVISPWPEALTQGFTISTISQGYEITPSVPYYEKIDFGIKVNELAQCKVSQEHTDSYEAMASYFGDSFYQLEHKMTVNPQVGGQTYDYYVRCEDGNGNANAAEYVIRFTTQAEPDKTAPTIEGTSVQDYGYVPAETTETGLSIYVNEPADCKWSYNDKKYDEMENMAYCEDTPTNALGYDTYTCYTTMNLTTKGVNTYYFRCQDKSEFKNQNQQSYEFHLTSTEQLEITSKSPEGILLDTVSPTLTATTSGGAEAGKAKCYFSDDQTRDILLWPEFYETDSTSHSQPLISLSQGEHNYYITCKDVAANEANATITFTIDKDTKAPEIEYLYVDTVALHVILDEPSTCEYSNSTFSFGTGSQMSGAGTTHNTVSAGENYYYINCEDAFANHWKNPIIVYL